MAKKVLNYDKATGRQIADLYNANQAAAAAQNVAYANQAAQRVQQLGQAAVAGRQFIDTSAAPGYQSPVTGQYTGMLMRGITAAPKAENKALLDLIKLRKTKQYLAGLDKSTKAGTGSYAGGFTTPATTTTTGSVNII